MSSSSSPSLSSSGGRHALTPGHSIFPEYAAWMAEAGIKVHPALSIRHSPECGYYGVAVAPISKDSPIFSVPREVCLNVGATAEDPLAAKLKAAGAPPTVVSAALLWANMQRDDSVLGAHVRVLKETHVTASVLAWGAREKELLRGTSVEASVGTQPLRQRFRETVLSALPGSDEDGLMHAAALVMSRCFQSPAVPEGAPDDTAWAAGSSWIVPACDLLNYDPEAVNADMVTIGNAFVMFAARDMEAGEEVFASYGRLSDGQLLHSYGYVPTPQGLSDKSSGAWLTDPALWATSNPYNGFLLSPSCVTSTLRLLLKGTGRWDAKREKVQEKAERCLKDTGVLPGSGISVSPATASTYSGSASALPAAHKATPAQFLESVIPRELLTAVAVLSMSRDEYQEYAKAVAETAAAQGGACPLWLTTPSLSTIAEKAAAKEGGGGGAAAAAEEEDDDDDDDEEEAANWWVGVQAVLVAKKKEFPTTLEEDQAWWAGVKARLAGEVAAPAKRVRTEEPVKPSAIWELPSEQAVELGVSDYLYRCCRLVALGEKEVLAKALRAVREELAAFEARYEDEDGDDDDEEDDSEEEED